MSNAKSRYKNAEGDELELIVDIDLTSQKLQEMRAKGILANKYADELKELESLVLGKTISEALSIKRESMTNEFRPEGKRAIASLSLWLLHRAIENYLGTETVLAETNDKLCLCFGIGVHDIRKKMLSRSDYELKNLIAETFATSACGSCLPSIKKTMEDLRLAHGMIEGRFDKEGHWVKIKGMYPGPLLILLDDLKKEWMEREDLNTQFIIELTGIEGVHLSLSVKTIDQVAVDKDRAEKILQALSEFYKSKTGVLFFLALSA